MGNAYSLGSSSSLARSLHRGFRAHVLVRPLVGFGCRLLPQFLECTMNMDTLVIVYCLCSGSHSCLNGKCLRLGEQQQQRSPTFLPCLHPGKEKVMQIKCDEKWKYLLGMSMSMSCCVLLCTCRRRLRLSSHGLHFGKTCHICHLQW